MLMAKTISKEKVSGTDTGSPASQISALTAEILKLTEHLKVNPKDYSSRRGLLKKVGNRKSLLRYLQSNEIETYKEVILANGLRG
jgi:small subunit ribosomal protein S15